MTGHAVIPRGAMMSPPPSEDAAHIASLEDWVRELGVEIRDHELRLRQIAEVAKGWRRP
jgi:hypothetical protein